MNIITLTDNLIALNTPGKIISYFLSLALVLISTFFVAYKLKRGRVFILFGILDASLLSQDRTDQDLAGYSDSEYRHCPPVYCPSA